MTCTVFGGTLNATQCCRLFIAVGLCLICLCQIHTLVGEMRSKFRDTVDVLVKVSSSDNVTAGAADHNHEQQLAELSKMILVMKVS